VLVALPFRTLSENISEIRVLLVRQIIKRKCMYDLIITRRSSVFCQRNSSPSPLRLISSRKQDSKSCQRNVEEDVEAEVSGEPLSVPRCITRSENLNVSEKFGKGSSNLLAELSYCLLPMPRTLLPRYGRLLRLASNIPRYQSEDQITLRQIELNTVECKEEANARMMCRGNGVDDSRANNCRSVSQQKPWSGMHNPDSLPSGLSQGCAANHGNDCHGTLSDIQQLRLQHCEPERCDDQVREDTEATDHESRC
jgi:hypothetical protein